METVIFIQTVDLCFMLIWVLSAFLVLKNSPHTTQLCPPDWMCLDSMWYLRLVDLDWKPHSRHCHLPPPRGIIICSTPCSIPDNRESLYIYSLGFSMFSAHMSVKAVSSSEELSADCAVVSPRLDVLGLNVIADIGWLGLIATLQALPAPPTKTAHHWGEHIWIQHRVKITQVQEHYFCTLITSYGCKRVE